MVFSSLIFLWMFLPIVLGLYFLTKESYRNVLLLVASLFFYAWGEPRYVSIMILLILINYAGALLIEKKDKKKTLLILTVLLDLSFLAYFKYSNFFIENINLLFKTDFDLLHIIMPIGISFYTFQVMS